MLFCKNLHKAFGTQVLFQGADFQLNSKERLGFVGRNGSGKSTLFRLICGLETPDDGDISYPDTYKIGQLDQHLEFNQPTILEQVAQSLAAEESHLDWQAKKILSGLGFSPADFDRSPRDFSGGFQMRIKLAELLMTQPDLLLLDEPTNHLDILATRWLENFLRDWPGEIICISHDQTFLERIGTHTLVLHREQFKKIRGIPSRAYAQIQREEDHIEKTRHKQAKETAQQEKFIREFRAGARSAGLVQSRIKMLAKRDTLAPLKPIPPIKFAFPSLPFTGAKVMEARNLSFGYGPGQDFFKQLSFEVFPGDRIGIVGANGRGKTTLLRLLNQELTHQAGVLKPNPKTTLGHMGQSNVDKLDGEKSILEELQTAHDVSEQMARNVAGNLLFSGGLAYKPIKILSGGEKARVNLGKILLTPTNLLLLDEPTNHLDYESIQALEKAVLDFEGAIIFISHNEHFVHKVAQKLIVFDNDQAFFHPETYQHFLHNHGFSSEQDETKLTTNKPPKPAQNDRETRRAHQRERQLLNRDLKKIEKAILALEGTQETNVENFKTAERQGNRLKMETLGLEYQALQTQLIPLTEKWDELAEEVAKLEKELSNGE